MHYFRCLNFQKSEVELFFLKEIIAFPLLYPQFLTRSGTACTQKIRNSFGIQVGTCDLHPITHRIPFGKQSVLQNQVAVVFGFFLFLISAAVSLSGAWIKWERADQK